VHIGNDCATHRKGYDLKPRPKMGTYIHMHTYDVCVTYMCIYTHYIDMYIYIYTCVIIINNMIIYIYVCMSASMGRESSRACKQALFK